MSETFFGHPVQKVGDIVDPCCQLADSVTLAGWKDTESCVQRARRHAAQRIRHSRASARENRQRQIQKMEARFAAQVVASERASEEARRQALHNTVQWLVEEAALEKTIYLKALKMACGWTIDALKRWESDIDWSALLSARIGEMQAMLISEQALVLRLAPGEFAQRFRQENALKDEHAGLLRILTDETLSVKQAVLGNQLVQVTIDLENEFANVIAQLVPVLRYMEQENGAEC